MPLNRLAGSCGEPSCDNHLRCSSPCGSPGSRFSSGRFAGVVAFRLAQSRGDAMLPLVIGQGAGGTSYSVPIQTLLFFTALSFLPAVLLLMTSFTRIVIVLSLLRQALGTQAAPPNQVVVGLSLFLTFFVMGPTIDKVYADAYQPYAENKIAFDEALKRGEVPMRAFMMKQTRQADVMLFAKLAKIDPAVKTADVPFKVLVPAFVTSELKSAFQIGFLVFLPFLIIDMIVASVLMSLGMMMLSPVLIALPFKLMLFVLADGWNLLLGSLAASFVDKNPPLFPSGGGRWGLAPGRRPDDRRHRHGLATGLHARPAEPLHAADGLGAGAADGARGRPDRQHLPGGDADPRGDAVVRAEDRRRGRGAGDRRAVDADLAGRVPAAHAAGDPTVVG